MPLAKYLDDLLALIQDDKDREASRAILEKYEPFQKSLLEKEALEQYRVKTEAERKDEQDRVKRAEDYVEQWKTWQETNEPRYNQMLSDYEKMQLEKEELQKKLQEAVANATLNLNLEEGEVDQNKLMALVEAQLAQKGYISKSEIEKLVNTQATKLAHDEAERVANERTDNFMKTTLPMQTRFNTALQSLQLKHYKEFNELLDANELFKYMADNKVDDPSKAYDQMLSPKRTEMEIETRVQKRLEEERKKLPVPGTNAPSAPELGPLEMYRTKKMPHIPDDAEPGSNQLSSLAAQELRAEGKW
jgi:hypothetical protein